MEELVVGAIVEAVKLSPAIGVLIWVAWRSDARAEACVQALLSHLNKEH